jgi:hypothetical protein
LGPCWNDDCPFVIKIVVLSTQAQSSIQVDCHVYHHVNARASTRTKSKLKLLTPKFMDSIHPFGCYSYIMTMTSAPTSMDLTEIYIRIFHS